MDLLNLKSFVLFLLVLSGLVDGNVVLIGKNVTLSFEDIEANFAPAIRGSGEQGVLYLAEPLNACAPLKNRTAKSSDSAFALIIRGGCTFDDKVRAAQEAGFHAVIVYNNDDHRPLVAMAGNSAGIRIHAVFVSKASGETLKKYAGREDIELWIIPNIENTAWSIMALSFISLLAMSAVLATCFFVRRHQIRREQPRNRNQEFRGMSKRLVKAMPTLIFTKVLDDNCTSSTCAICLEDYTVGERLRILPCRHKFHASCIDSWLTSWRTFCPVCKQDAQKSTGDPPPSECTPLLSSASSTPFSSFHSSMPASSAIQIPPSPIQANPTPLCSPLTSRGPSPHGIRISRSSADLQSMHYYQRSHASSSLGYPRSLHLNSRLVSSYVSVPYGTSTSCIAGSSSRHSYLRHCNESGSIPCNTSSYIAGSLSQHSYLRHCNESSASLSAMDSAQSLPEC